MSGARRPACLVIAGPTASGKSEVALLLAERLAGEIISVDSMQVYRGMDIGTAKPTPAERARVPHHLIDVAEVTARFDAAQFARLARSAIAEIQGRGRVPILCGGTGLYFRAVLEGLGSAPPADASLRQALEKMPPGELLDELARSDPITYQRIDRQNPRRIIRAVEVIRATGRPFSEQRAAWGAAGALAGAFGLRRETKDLHQRINHRVDLMFAQGLVEETKQLLQGGLSENPTAMQALGYRQVVEHLRGERPLKETIELVKLRTRQFAKRQMTWFRGQMGLQWIDVTPERSVQEVAALVFEAVT
jgi:tRNA dimethylallyltransferase